MSDGLLDGRYRLQEELGAGAFGVVHRAEHEVLGVSLRSVAVKIFGEGPGGVPAQEQMLAEAMRITRLVEGCDDPWVRDRFVTCYDAAAGDQPYLVMELAAGDLGRQVAHAQLPAAPARDRLAEIAAGVAFLHEQGVLHLDLKPSNVVVGRSGGLKVADFGAAARVCDLVAGDAPRGTLVYQAPEILDGATATPAADVYALGLIGYELLTGRLPHEEKLTALAGDQADPARIAKLADLKREVLPRPGDVNPAVAGDPVEAVVMRALEPLASGRQRHAGELLAELRGSSARSGWRTADPEKQVAELIDLVRIALAKAHGDPTRLATLETDLVRAHAEVPTTVVVPEFYPVAVQAALTRGDVDTARQRAREGLRQRRCPETYAAMSAAFAGTVIGRGFDGRARARGADA